MTKPSKKRKKSLAATQNHRFQRAIRLFRTLPGAGTRDLYVVRNVTSSGEVFGNFDAKLAEITEVLRSADHFYNFDDEIVVERGEGETGNLVTLAGPTTVAPAAWAYLANHLVCEIESAEDDEPPRQFPPPRKLIETLLHRTATRRALPVIRCYYRRPILDASYRLRLSGYHGDIQTLVHCLDVDVPTTESVPRSMPIRERLPLHLRQLMQDFCFQTDSDVANAVALMLTGLLANLLIEFGKPVFVFDGNQPNLGKTMFACCVATILDGLMPLLNRYVTDELELEKQLVATLRDRKRTTLVVDNAKVRTGDTISSVTIEALSVAARLSGRILGTSENFERPNDVLWIFTMNGCKLSPDLTTRSVAIRFFLEGNPSRRNFDGRNPIEYAKQHRGEILGELIAMVYRWTQLGRNAGSRRHRLTTWVETIGGILEANGLPEFLANQDEAVAAFDSAQDDLAAIAETVLQLPDRAFAVSTDEPSGTQLLHERARPASDWVQWLRIAGVAREKLEAAKADQARRTIVGALLTPLVGRSVSVVVRDIAVTATLRSFNGRARSKQYCFEVSGENATALVTTATRPAGREHRDRDGTFDNDRPVGLGEQTSGEPKPVGSTAEVHRQ